MSGGVFLDFLIDRFRAWGDRDALVWRGRTCSYSRLLGLTREALRELETAGVPRGAVVALEADFSPGATAHLLALVEHGCVAVPMGPESAAHREEYVRTAEVEWVARWEDGDRVALRPTGSRAAHPLYAELRSRRHPGLVLFSSGSTGARKAALHDFDRLLEKYRTPRPGLRTLCFLLFDHIGGVDTLLHTLSNGGAVVTVSDRSPDAVCAAVERHRVEVLPVTPTFLHLLLLSGAHRRHDLASLRVVTYGTEVMPESTLAAVREALPHVRLLQKYGLTELGTLRSQSRSSESVWVRVGGEGYETRVVDGVLEIRARSAMLGYLNAPSPFTADGWFRTGDSVEVDGEFLRILGRQSERINVGGEKLHPAEVEEVLQKMEGVEEVVVTGEAHPLTGSIVAARVRLSTTESLGEFRRRMLLHCKGELPPFKIPQKVVLTREPLHGERYKKARRSPEPIDGETAR